MGLAQFLTMQYDTTKLASINMEKAVTNIELTNVQEQITDITEIMQNQEDSVQLIVTNKTAEVNQAYQDAIKASNSKTSEYKAVVEGAKTSFDNAKDLYDKAVRANESSDVIDTYKTAMDAAEKTYNQAKDAYEAQQTESQQEQQSAYSTLQTNLANINQWNQSVKNTFTEAQKANQKSLQKQETRLELRIQELDVIAKNIQAEKDSAKETAEQKAQDLAPKFS